jgi:hypothetical protein
MSASPKPRSSGSRLIRVVAILIFACIACGIVSYVVAGPAIMNVFNTLAAPLTASNDFMAALVAKDYTKAFNLVHPSQQEAFGGSPEGLEQLFTDGGLLPASYNLVYVQVGEDAIVNGTGVFDGATKYVYVSLRKDGDAWKILGLDINDNPPTATPTS